MVTYEQVVKDERLVEYAVERQYRKKYEKFRFFEPQPHQEGIFIPPKGFGKRITIDLVQTSNRWGKTLIACQFLIAYLLGGELYGKLVESPILQEWSKHIPQEPTDVLICSLSYKKIDEVWNSKLFAYDVAGEGYLPKRFVSRIKRNSQGYLSELHTKFGSKAHFMSYDQDPMEYEAAKHKLVLFDEPPKRNIWIAVKRGLVDLCGHALFTMTPIDEPWIGDEIYDQASMKPNIRAFTGDITDNKYLTKEAIEDFLDGLDDDEIEARAHGKWTTKSGRIYKSLDDAIHLTDDIEIPENITWWEGIDPHEVKPTHYTLAYKDSEGRFTWLDYLKLPSQMTINEMAQAITDKRSEYGAKDVMTIIDPATNKGSESKVYGDSIVQQFQLAGIPTLPNVNKDIAAGHKQVREFLKPRYSGVLKEVVPLMRWHRRCASKGGPYYEMKRYCWPQDKQDRLKYTEKKPEETHKDFPDCIRYVAMCNPIIVEKMKTFGKQPQEGYA